MLALGERRSLSRDNEQRLVSARNPKWGEKELGVGRPGTRNKGKVLWGTELHRAAHYVAMSKLPNKVVVYQHELSSLQTHDIREIKFPGL